MTLMTLVRRAEALATNNSPLILTGIGVAGTITTAVLTGRAAFKAQELIWNNDPIYTHNNNPAIAFDTKDKVKLTWKLFIPPAATGVVTVAAIITANQIGTRRAAAMAAAYAVSEKAFSEYKDKVVEKIGENKERAVRDDIAQDRVNASPVENKQIIIASGGNVLCYEPLTDRYFDSDMETLKKAMNDLNYRINNNMYASLSEFYDLIGLAHTKFSDDLGWNSNELLELSFSTTLASDGRPCIVVDYKVGPKERYSRVY